MTEEKLLSMLLRETYTKSDILRRLRLLREYLEFKYFSSERQTDLSYFLAKHNVPEVDIGVFASFSDEFYASFTKENAYTELTKLSEAVDKQPQIVVLVPYDFGAEEIMRLGRWMRTNIHPQMIIELRNNPTLLGGCAFAYEGYYHDFSLRYYMMKKREEIRAIIAKYADEFK